MHIIVYVLDALRFDHLGCYGYERETSPYIDALAREGVVFENCFTSTTWTRPVAASILTGTYPGVHLARSRYEMFSTTLYRLPQVLRDGGFKTVAFSTMGNLASEIGFAEGFDQYYDLFRDPAILAKRHKLDAAEEGLVHTYDQEIALPRAEDVHNYLFSWLEEYRTSNTFNFIWSIETHVPYNAPPKFRRFSDISSSQPDEGDRQDIRSAGAADRQRLMNLYDDVIFYNDDCIGRIVNQLEELGLYEDSLFIITGDHGDAFYEHGTYSHGHAPYEELIHVPMIMKLPAKQYAGRRVTGLVELIDLFPTIIASAGLEAIIRDYDLIQGYNLLPLCDGTCSQVREYTFSDTQSLNIQNHYLSVRDQRWKYIQLQRPKVDRSTLFSTVKHVIKRRILLDILRTPRHFLRRYRSGKNEYLFDLQADPYEQNNLVDRYPDLVAKFRQVLVDWQAKNDELARQVGNSSRDHDESEILHQHLEKLGYL